MDPRPKGAICRCIYIYIYIYMVIAPHLLVILEMALAESATGISTDENFLQHCATLWRRRKLAKNTFSKIDRCKLLYFYLLLNPEYVK